MICIVDKKNEESVYGIVYRFLTMYYILLFFILPVLQVLLEQESVAHMEQL